MELIVNLKSYNKGKKLISLIKKVKRANKNTIVCPQPEYLEDSSKIIKTYAQHVDFQDPGKNTGYIILEDLKSLGIKGSLLNHSEHPINISTIKKTLKRADKLKFKIIVCVPNLKSISNIKKLKPYAIAFEDPKLVGTGKSITKHRSNDLLRFTKMLKNTKIIPMCGAGISSRGDIQEAKKLGCKGVLLSSAVAKKGNVNIL